MGITEQYLRYVASGAPFGIIASTNGHVVFVELKGSRDRYVACTACENVLIWDTKTGEHVKTLPGDKVEAVSLSQHFETTLLASGYSDGSVRVFNYNTEELKVTFAGHKSAVSCVAFDGTGMRLASGGKDTEIVVWDVVSESGLFRLKGHKHVITNLQFMKDQPDILISSSRDTFVKFWDLQTQHCFKTLIGHRSEVWDFVYLDKVNRLITGAGDSELRVWNISFDKSEANEDDEEKPIPEDDASDEEREVSNQDESYISITKLGSILRKSTSRVQSLTMDTTGRIMVCHGNENVIEAYKLRTEDEIKEALMRRLKKERKRIKRAHPEKTDADLEDLDIEITLTDEIECLEPFRALSKVKYCNAVAKDDRCKIVALTMGNAIELFAKDKTSAFESTSAITLEGHRTDVRTLCFSSDNLFVLSASADAVKVWSRGSRRCIATINDNCGYALCSLFTPGDKGILVGTKEGDVHIYDVGAAQRLETIRASDDGQAIWSMDLFPNRKGIVTGSEDKLVKFWDFEFVASSMLAAGANQSKRLTILHKRTLKMDEGILCVKITPNAKLVAVSLLDSTIKVFFFDTLKFFLSLYGHKFPVLCMDISTDSTIIATGSSDKNIKLWGLDFGDCHKSIFAHDDSVTGVQFVPNTHQLFSCGKDKLVKQWDADNYEKIISLGGHQAEVWSLAVSPNGKFVVSASHDKSLRLWERTQEPLILEEEQEQEREEAFEKNAFAGDEPVLPGETNQETGLASKKTVETVKATELLLEAVDVHKEESAAMRVYETKARIAASHGKEPPQAPTPNPIMGRFNTSCPDRFVLETLKRIKSSELDEALLTLPFDYVASLLAILAQLMAKGWEVELLCRCVTFLCRIHFGQISTSRSLLGVIDKLRGLSIERASQLKDIAGVNLSGLRYMQDQICEKEEVSLFSDAFARQKEKRKKKAKRNPGEAVPVLKLS